MASSSQQYQKDLLNQLQFAIFQRKYHNALSHINEIIQMNEEDSALYYQRALINYQLERFYDCISDCKRANKYKFSEIKVCALLIKCYMECAEVQIAEQALQQFLSNHQEIKELFSLKDRISKLKSNQEFRLDQKEEVILREMKEKLYNAGAYFDKLKVVNLSESYRGVVATKSIKKKERIVFIPKSQIITLEMARKNDICLEVIKNKVQFVSPKHTYISIFLLEEMCKIDSLWKLYLDILPKDHNSFPINYNSNELNELLGSTFLYQIKEKVYDLKKDFDMVAYCSEKFKAKYSFKEFCWARTIVGSRIFGLNIDGSKTQILVPFADMLNHRTPKQTVWNYCQQTNGFFIESLIDIPPGQEVFDSYGRKCNSRFLLNYGFVLENNKDNEICMKVQLDPKDENKLKKIQMLKQKSLQPRIFKISNNIEENNFFEFMGFLRFKNIYDIETLTVLEKISGIKTSNDPYFPSRTPPITTELELRIWKDFKEMCISSLKEYPTTLEQDLNHLKSANLNENQRNILILRTGQKQILTFYILIADEITQILSEGYKKAKQKLGTNADKIWARYIDKILGLMPHEKTKSEREANMKMLEEKQEQIENQIQNDD